MLALIYRIHKWIGVAIGVVLVMWVVTGVLIPGDEEPNRRPDGPSLAGAMVPPATAIRTVLQAEPAAGPITAVALGVFGEAPVYEVRWAGGGRMVDAAGGGLVEVDEARARAIAASELPGGHIIAVEQIHRPDRGYPYGLFPVWRVRFDDESATWVHVPTREARVVRNTGWSRAKNTMRGLHTFGTLQVLRIPEGGIRALLAVAGVIALTGILTGYYLALPRSWRPTRG